MNKKHMRRGNGSGERTATPRRHLAVALCMGGLALGMVGLSYAAVPLYRIFCQVTGYGGTTQRAADTPGMVLDRTVTVRFDANVGHGLGWRFRPVQLTRELRLGESVLAFYEAENQGSKTITGTATFNVTPEAAGRYFSKIECFCFTEQTLKAGERADMPVTFFIDPDMVDDPETANIREITLSYTFFPVRQGADVAAARGAKQSPDGS